MFDKLIETEPEGANIHNRRSYFMVSSIVVGILFITAVVISIYASDYGLGSNSFELSTVVAPPDVAPPEPLQPRPANQPQSQSSSSAKPTFVAPLDAAIDPPKTISTTPNFIPVGTDKFPKPATDYPLPNGTGREQGEPGNGDIGLSNSRKTAEPEPETAPPPTVKTADTKPKIIRSTGPVNGHATYLPKPAYPAPAIAINLQGKVDVQVTIDETGKVVSAKAVSGHVFFRPGAERAAWDARFKPTYLNNAPVKVTGMIVYNFTKH